MKFFSSFSRKRQSDGDESPDYPELVVAIWRDDLDRLRDLSKSPDVIDPDGRTGLMAAAIDSKVEAARILVDAGADVDTQDPGGWSALHFAAQSGSTEVAEILLDGGASVDPADSHGNTPLWRAMFEYRGNGQLIQLLRSHGANPKKENGSGISPLELARTITNFDVAQLYDD